MGLPNKLITLRTNKAVSLQHLADAVGVSKTHIWQLEKGITTNPTLGLIQLIADFYDVSTQYLIGDDPESNEADEFALAMYRKMGDLDQYDREVIGEMIASMLKRKKNRDNEIKQNGHI